MNEIKNYNVVICKRSAPENYYNKITPKKSYVIVDPRVRYVDDKYYIIHGDDGHLGYFLKEYFYTKEELRQESLDILLT